MFVAMVPALGYVYAKTITIRAGLRALLRDRILQAYKHYHEDKGYCPIYALENVEEMYKQYYALGGNGTITKLLEELKELPTSKKENEFYMDFESVGDTINPQQSGRPVIKALQNALNLDGYRDDTGKQLEEDGKVGPKTRAAVQKVVLKLGSSGLTVNWAQKRLNELSGAGLEEDGEYGPATEAVVKNRQRTAGLKVDGLCGPKTINSLL